MKILAKEPGRLLMEGNTLCTACASPHCFLVEYDCVQDRYNEPGDMNFGNGYPLAEPVSSRDYRTAAF
ncbi:hypothetical protein [Saccharibacillus sacchari]|uniref:Uncharacterized protein n=1 Tax=Saccharibacillus sacchari TaxID=456493 RepID=A0ACC6P6T1_9BACL